MHYKNYSETFLNFSGSRRKYIFINDSLNLEIVLIPDNWKNKECF